MVNIQLLTMDVKLHTMCTERVAKEKEMYDSLAAEYVQMDPEKLLKRNILNIAFAEN